MKIMNYDTNENYDSDISAKSLTAVVPYSQEKGLFTYIIYSLYE